MPIRADSKMNSVRMAKIRQPFSRKGPGNRLSASQLHKLDQTYGKYALKPKAPHILRFYDVEGTKVYVYTTMTLLVQGKNEERLKAEIDGVIGTKGVAYKFRSEADEVSRSQIGADEVGVGDYFGPVVTAAVHLPANLVSKMGGIGVKDSKQLKDKDIVALAQQIGAQAVYSVQIAWPEEYNRMIAAGMTAHHVKTYLHNKALSEVFAKVKADKPLVILDQFASADNYNRYSRDLKQAPAPIDIFAVQAEGKYPAVAAASIIARAAFLQAIKKLESKYGMRLPLGATNVIEQAREFYRRFGQQGLNEAAKVHFKTTEKVTA